MLNIVILAFENCLMSGVAGVMDIFALANWEHRRLQPDLKTPFCRCEIVTVDGESVASFNRSPIIPKRSINDCGDPDLILVPGMMGRPELLLEQTTLLNWITRQHKNGAVIASACSGAFLLAEAGILDGRSATTHWQLATTM